jgi:hypothetical protein
MMEEEEAVGVDREAEQGEEMWRWNCAIFHRGVTAVPREFEGNFLLG